jgi:hypothetical protein
MSAGCGQLFIARREAYERCGGHAMLRDSLHDGIKLPRLFRQAGFATNLFDATDLATCHMYHTNADTWRGLGKNATEGLAAPLTILTHDYAAVLRPSVAVRPPGLRSNIIGIGLGARHGRRRSGIPATAPRRAPVPSTPRRALLHPLGVGALLAIQWHALVRRLAGRPSVWKDRSYSVAEPAKAA